MVLKFRLGSTISLAPATINLRPFGLVSRTYFSWRKFMQIAGKGRGPVFFVWAAIIVVGAVGIQLANAQTETVLHTFTGSPDGAYPQQSALLPLGGNLYGVTDQGGATNHGAVFELTPGTNGTWNESVIYNFTGGTDGSFPIGALIADSAGNLYGMANSGGTQNTGVVFELTNSGGTWQETVIHNFGSGFDGQYPQGPLVFDSQGNLFGTTVLGGGLNGGTVFEMTLTNGAWTETVLHNFGGTGDGYLPYGGVTVDGKGNVYGTTQAGGTNSCLGLGCGIAFELVSVSGSWTENILHQFSGGSDGFYPNPKLVMDRNGNLYGTTIYGGGLGQCTSGIDSVSCGTVYELAFLNGAWHEKVLYRFTGGSGGSEPNSPLTFDGVGNLFGETAQVGSNNGGLFRLHPTVGGGWAFKLFFTFDGTNGANPEGGVRIGPGGTLYGTTIYGGTNSYGVVFSVKP
jgi:uncharacterized repeat protein (TIGR03803 family)